ncbi:hypothetical protein AAG570_006725 [Ranatra chinensis]|uniref:Hexosyltransferase n=1 Tax=Ranatra chinensis TaxID=642074 RepID=A0ABD0ZG55_9HEMI
MQTILYHNSSGKDAFTGNLKQKEVHRAITLHPVKQYKHLYRIHNYMQMLRVQELQQESLNLHRDILSMSKLLNIPLTNFIILFIFLGKLPGLKKYNVKNIKEIQSWEFIQRALYSASDFNPKRRLEAPLREGLEDVIREVMDLINMYSKQRGRVIDFKEILYGYYQYNALYGANYILDMLLVYKKYRGRKMTVPVRRHAYLQQQFTVISTSDEQVEYPTENNLNGFKEPFENGLIKIGQSQLSALSQGTTSGFEESQKIDKKVINFILPLAGRFESFRRFATVFEDECLRRNEKVTLTVVMFLNDEDKSDHGSMELVRDLQERYRYTRISVVPVFDNFARAKALQVGASHVEDPDDLLFFIDVDVIFRSNVLYRIRSQTVRGKQVYFPIVFSEFDPQIVYNKSTSPNHFLINNNAGFWRQYGFGIASVYKSDLIKVGGFNTSIKGWGKEDVDLFDKFIASAHNLTIFRSVDRDLVHVFHVVECDSQLEESQLRMCKGTRADTYGGVQQLAEYIGRTRFKASKIINSIEKQTNR